MNPMAGRADHDRVAENRLRETPEQFPIMQTRSPGMHQHIDFRMAEIEKKCIQSTAEPPAWVSKNCEPRNRSSPSTHPRRRTMER